MASIQYLLDRALVPPDYGDRLRAAGLNNGVGRSLESRASAAVRLVAGAESY